jgi:predicted MFS family arabinose efflux permease
MDKYLATRADRTLWQQCISMGMALGALAGWLMTLRWHWASVGMGMGLGVFAGAGAFFPIRRWKARRHA